ncbi:MAG TPA: PIN domain-containing protein [Candidatus Heimdallarchaeota archaeon]|nr:PIN domain-containing protein [Candidatus Heimdallarchaeota archaeon]
MNIFIDTSAFLAVLDESDINHAAAKTFWKKLISEGDVLLCHNYILVETSALVLRRLGIEAIRVFEQDIIPILRTIWVNKEVHTAAVGAHLVADRRTLSLVDCVSFEIMRRIGVHKAFAFDRHFQDYGFDLNPI